MIASLYCKLAMAWWEDEHGDRTRAVEAMIDAEKAALRVYQLSRYPYMYASRQNNLGMAYRNRVEGDQSANVEQAIASYMAALEIFTPDAYPGDYAMVQLNLGIAYQNRIVGERGTNLEQAINCHQFALPFYGYDSFLLKWAWLQYYLGNAYYYRIEGTRQANLEQAITHFEAALRVIIHEAFPQQWAEMQYYLGLIYSERSAGDPSANQALSRGYIVDASCHGSFNIRAPLDSALQLAKGLRLLILSACQTAILDMRGAMDEAHSLAVGMVQAGAEAVLAALWRVDDKATYLLIARFAQEWLPRMKQEPPAAALARAQYWLRTVTNRELRDWQANALEAITEKEQRRLRSRVQKRGSRLEASGMGQVVATYTSRFDASEAEKIIGTVAKHQHDPDACPYADLVYWAGFQVVGW